MSISKKSQERIVNQWRPPVEGFVPDSKYTEPLCMCKNDTDLVDEKIDKIQIKPGEVILAHETDEKSASRIINNGFNIKSNNPDNIRSNAIFGWLNSNDIGTHQNTTKDNANYVVLFKSDKKHICVSSYKSVEELILNGLSYIEYEKYHTVSYDEFENIIWSGKIKDIGYDKFNLIGSKTI